MVKFANLLPKGEQDAKRFLTIAMQVLTQKPDLLRKATRESVLNCLIECARLRLDPEGALGHAYLIPYKNQCTVQVSYKGFIQLVKRAKSILDCWSYPVWDGEEFKIIAGQERKLIHVPDLTDEERESSFEGLRGTYACAQLFEGVVDFEWMNLATIKKIRGKSSAWEEWPVEMAKIRPLKRLMKRQQTTEETLANGLALDDREGLPREAKKEIEGEVIEVTTREEETPLGTEIVEETRADINTGIERAWKSFHEAKLDPRILDMQGEFADYLNPDMTSDAEAWKFRDHLIRETLKVAARH